MPNNVTKLTAKSLHATKIDIDADARVGLVELLNQQLADTMDLYTQTKQAHWNVKGMHFIQLHELFDQLAADVLPFVDMLAERATSLGGVARGTARQTAATSTLEELSIEAGGVVFVEALSERYASLAASTRAAITRAEELDDASTADLFTEISRQLDKSLWFLEAHLQS